MLTSIILGAFLFICGLACIFSMCKREDSYLDWLGNYNLPKEKDDDKKR